MKENEDIILTPIYKGIVYQYHECSNCKREIYFEESMFVPFHFEEKIKYCPFCGKKVIRYAKPKYVEEIDWSWIEEYEKIIENTYELLEYKIHCKKGREEINELRDKARAGEEYFGNYGNDFTGRRNVCSVIYNITREKLHYTTKNKLEQKFKEAKT